MGKNKQETRNSIFLLTINTKEEEEEETNFLWQLDHAFWETSKWVHIKHKNKKLQTLQ